MPLPRLTRLLGFAAGSLTALTLAATAGAACPPHPLPPCTPAAFTGSVRARSSVCDRPPPLCPATERGTRGLGGIAGKRGAVGKVGARGPAGVAGASGAPGQTGASGVPGATGPQGPSGGPQGPEGPRGVAGGIGATGIAGAAGPRGSAGTIGPTGIAGAGGPPGSIGPAGTTGSTGPAGLVGSTGPTGVNGPAGAVGPPGAVGAAGPAGPAGAAGSTGVAGATGPAGLNGLSQYAYVYNLAEQSVPLEAPVTFDSNGVMTSGITHAPGGSGITLVNAGVYQVTFSLSGTGANQIALFDNGTVVPGTVYGSGSGTQQNAGQVILAVSAGDVLSVRNATSTAAILLATPIGGTRASTNASLTIEKLA